MKNFPFDIGTVHIVGIGGIGMSGYAEVLHHQGYQVQGSDQADNANVQRLKKLGVKVFVGQKADNIAGASVVVRSTAVKDDNPEIKAAMDAYIPIVSRSGLLSEIMRNQWCIAISGTHGKTTTTSMIGHVLDVGGIDPTIINGGIINSYGSNTRMGQGRWMVVEADESDGTFSHLPAVLSVITNIDPEHLDHYGDVETLKDEFVAFAQQLPFYGALICCIDHPTVRELMPRFQCRTITYGTSEDADIRVVNLVTTIEGLRFDVALADGVMTKYPRLMAGVTLPMFGPHNALNALTTFAAGHEIGIDPDKIIAALATFQGVKRRFTVTGTANGVTIIDDYGHHPVEIAAVLRAGRDLIREKRAGHLIAVVQPHRYSRLQNLFTEFSNCFQDADEIIVADVYAAGEVPIAGYDAGTLAEGIARSGKKNVHRLGDPSNLPALIKKIAKEDDIVICLGAGSITTWANALPGQLLRETA